jgi:hypothetical protein
MHKGRNVVTWCRTHAVRLRIDSCTQCGEPITFGSYRREVWIYPHERYGDEFVVRRYHEEPVCPKYLEWER